MDNRETSAEDAVFEYTGDGCTVPRDVINVRIKEGLQKIGTSAFRKCKDGNVSKFEWDRSVEL